MFRVGVVNFAQVPTSGVVLMDSDRANSRALWPKSLALVFCPKCLQHLQQGPLCTPIPWALAQSYVIGVNVVLKKSN